MMKIKTATEMAIQVPTSEDLEVMKVAIPDPANFPLPEPEQVRLRTQEYAAGRAVDSVTYQFLTGHKQKGKGLAISSYPRLYENAIVPLQDLWPIKEDPKKIVDYLLEHPIRYKIDKNPSDALNEDGSINVGDYVARCLSNLLEWLYLPSAPCYQYLREHLLEKARHLRKLYSNNGGYSGVTVLPQRKYTSRSLGKDETPLRGVNGGYRIIDEADPYSSKTVQALQLVTWIFSDAHTKQNVYVDYFDIENGNLDEALKKLRQSELYRAWARDLTPAQYDAQCKIFKVDEGMEQEVLKELTPLD